MSKILCIPDIHCRKFWRKPVEIYSDKVDKIVFLGDYLDPYSEEIMMAPELMECNNFYDSQNLLKMLEDIISLKKNEPDKYILLCGNHTCSYIWPKFQAATRTDYKNWEKYHKFFSENLKYFNLVWIEDNVIFSHAGISEGWANEFLYHYIDYDPLEKNSLIFEAARVLKDTELKDFNIHYIKAISNISHYRGGDYFYGSCEWADIREHIEKVISYENNTFIGKGDPGIFQVFGHTQLKTPLICDKWACLDCRKAFIFDTETHECKDCI
jgi:predicted MPP superfamily phosphohydrolase